MKTKPRPRLLSATGHFLPSTVARLSSSFASRALAADPLDEPVAIGGRQVEGVVQRHCEARASVLLPAELEEALAPRLHVHVGEELLRAFRLAVLSCPAGRTPCRRGAPPPASGSTRGTRSRWWCRRRSRPGRTRRRGSPHRASSGPRGTGASPSRPRRRSRARGTRKHRREQLVGRERWSVGQLPLVIAGQQFERDLLAGVGQRGLEAVPADERDALPRRACAPGVSSGRSPVDARAAVVVPARDAEGVLGASQVRARTASSAKKRSPWSTCRGRAWRPRRERRPGSRVSPSRPRAARRPGRRLASLRSARTRSSRTFMPRTRP